MQRFMAPMIDFEGGELEHFQSWACQPCERNYERIPGLVARSCNAETFVREFMPSSVMTPCLQALSALRSCRGSSCFFTRADDRTAGQASHARGTTSGAQVSRL